MHPKKWTWASVLVVGCVSGASFGDEFQKPIQLTAGGKPIDVQRTGHSAPFVGDFDGDGLNDLLVGEFHEGRLRIFRNVGSNQMPKFESYKWFKTGAELGRFQLVFFKISFCKFKK